MTLSGRGEPSLTDAVTGTHPQRQGSISSSELLGLKRARPRGPWRGLVFLVVVMLVIVVGGGVFVGPRLREAAYDLARSNPQIMRLPMVPEIVRERLGDKLTTPAGTRATPVKFTVEGDQSVAQIGRALASQGLITDALAFSYLAVTQGVDDKLHTGSFNLDPTMTPQQILTRLQSPPDPVTTRVLLNLRAGLRLEQIAAYLQTVPLTLDETEFLQLMTDPPDWVRTEFPWLSSLPAGRNLEGFMGLGSIPVDADISPDDLLRVLLTRWETDIGPDVIADIEGSGQDFYKVLTLASIVQKEVTDPRELEKVAGVYTNRLKDGAATGGLLQADPTVSYAVDTDKLAKLPFKEWRKYKFFNAVSNQSKRKVSSAMRSYQTYQNPGLPDGPIDSPPLTVIRAAANPDTKDRYLYFYSCPNSDTHTFARTLAAQKANIAKCK